MRISNTVRKIEDTTLTASKATARVARIALRKTAMGTIIVVAIPVSTVACAYLGAINCAIESLRCTLPAAAKALKEV
jgi:hypothetical protein